MSLYKQLWLEVPEPMAFRPLKNFKLLCTVGHSTGVIVIAEGIRSDAEWAMLQELGADDGTGPGVNDPLQ